MNLDNLNPYFEKARELGIKPLKNKNKRWLLIDGLEIKPNPISISSKTNYVSLKPEQSYLIRNYPINLDVLINTNISDRVKKVGHYNENNGILSFVDENGNLYSAPDTPDRFNSLIEAGYTSSYNKEIDFSVPLSNWESPANPELRTKFLKWCGRANKIRRNSRERK